MKKRVCTPAIIWTKNNTRKWLISAKNRQALTLWAMIIRFCIDCAAALGWKLQTKVRSEFKSIAIIFFFLSPLSSPVSFYLVFIFLLLSPSISSFSAHFFPLPLSPLSSFLRCYSLPPTHHSHQWQYSSVHRDPFNRSEQFPTAGSASTLWHMIWCYMEYGWCVSGDIHSYCEESII